MKISDKIVISGELFLNFLVDTILVFPANFLALMLLLRFGRRLPYILLTLLAGVCFVVCMFLQNTSKLPVIILSMLGSFCVSITFTLLWIWTSELMPTTVRNAGVGACSFAARIGVVSKWSYYPLSCYPLLQYPLLYYTLL